MYLKCQAMQMYIIDCVKQHNSTANLSPGLPNLFQSCELAKQRPYILGSASDALNCCRQVSQQNIDRATGSQAAAAAAAEQ
jgi:hypothetical protein